MDNFVILPVDGGRAWEYFLYDDAREVVAVSARQYQRREECDAAIAELFNRYEFAMTVRQRHDGQWHVDVEDLLHEALVGVHGRVEEGQAKARRERDGRQKRQCA